MTTKNEQQESIQEFVNRKYIEFVNRKGRMASASEFARWLGVTNTNLSQWMSGNRKPTGVNVHRLAAKLGPVVYDLVGEPRRMPDDPGFQQVAAAYFEADDQARAEVARILEEAKARKLGTPAAET